MYDKAFFFQNGTNMETSNCIYDLIEEAECSNCSYPYINDFFNETRGNVEVCRTLDELRFAKNCIMRIIGDSRYGECPGPCTDPKYTGTVFY